MTASVRHEFCPRRGTILIVVMLIIAALAGMVLAVGRAARVEAMASANHVADARAAAVERAAEQYVLALVAEQRDTVLTLDESSFAGVPVGEAGAFWIVRPDYGDSSMPVYGLVDETSKLNIQSATRDMLNMLPNIPPELPDCIFDWKDGDADVEGDGAEDQYYTTRPKPYRCKNGPFETVEELLLVRGAYPELLFGDGLGDTQGAGGSSSASIGGLSDTELAARGLYDYLTVYSRQPQGNNRSGRINVNTAPREVLRCLPGLTDADADAMVQRRPEFGSTDSSWVAGVLGPRMGAVQNLITADPYQFSAEIVAASSDGRAFRRARIVVDASDQQASRPRVVYRNDLTEKGWPLDRAILDGMRAGTFVPTR
jgi:type II secretory pathway component PulK